MQHELENAPRKIMFDAKTIIFSNVKDNALGF